MEIRLLELRQEKQLTQDDVARQMKISRQAYALYETNQRHMNYDSLRALAGLFSVSIDYLLGGENKNTENLTDEELRFIRDFRELDGRGRASVKALVEFEHSQIAQGRKSR